LPLAAAELVRTPIGELGREADPVEQLVAARLDLGGRQTVEPSLQPHVLAPGEQEVQGRLLERDADLVSHSGTLADDVVAGDAR
jgi:hypothetical protein